MKDLLKRWANSVAAIVSVVIGLPLLIAALAWCIFGWAAAAMAAAHSVPMALGLFVLWILVLGAMIAVSQ